MFTLFSISEFRRTTSNTTNELRRYLSPIQKTIVKFYNCYVNKRYIVKSVLRIRVSEHSEELLLPFDYHYNLKMLGSGDSGHVIKLRGLPFSTTVDDVLDFLSGVNVVNGKEGDAYIIKCPISITIYLISLSTKF